MRYDLGPADRHAALAFHRLRFLSILLKEELAREGLWDDLIQEVYTAALEAWKQWSTAWRTWQAGRRGGGFSRRLKVPCRTPSNPV